MCIRDSDWTVTGRQKGTALYNDRETISWSDEDPAFGDSFQFTLGDDLFLKNNASYEVYVAFNLLLKPGGFGGDIEMDAMNTVSYTHLDVYKRQASMCMADRHRPMRRR